MVPEKNIMANGFLLHLFHIRKARPVCSHPLVEPYDKLIIDIESPEKCKLLVEYVIDWSSLKIICWHIYYSICIPLGTDTYETQHNVKFNKYVAPAISTPLPL